MKSDLADELNISVEGLVNNITNIRIEGKAPTHIDDNTACTASSTFYVFLGRLEKAAKIVEGKIRSIAAGVGASTTLDILKVPSGTAPSSGTAIVTQVALNGITANTDSKLAPKTDGSENCAAGDMIFAKVVTQASETLKPLAVSLRFKP